MDILERLIKVRQNVIGSDYDTIMEAAQEIERLRKENNKANGLLKIVHEWMMPLALNKGYISVDKRNNALSVLIDVRQHIERHD